MTTVKDVRKSRKLTFRIEIESGPEVQVSGWKGVSFLPTNVTGEWVEESPYPETRYVEVYGNTRYGVLRQEFALDPEYTMTGRPMAPEWLLEVLESAGIDY